jgi:hypothetical protein
MLPIYDGLHTALREMIDLFKSAYMLQDCFLGPVRFAVTANENAYVGPFCHPIVKDWIEGSESDQRSEWVHFTHSESVVWLPERRAK